MTPPLTSARLSLIPYTAGLVAARHVAWLNDSEVVRYSEQRHKTHTLESQHEYLNKFPVGSHIWLISRRVSSADALYNGLEVDIGTITAYIDMPNRIADVGILIGDKSTWGQGYGAEAWMAVIDFLFSAGIRKIECGCMLSNIAMRKLAKKVGMVWEGTRMNHFELDSLLEDLILMGRYRKV